MDYGHTKAKSLIISSQYSKPQINILDVDIKAWLSKEIMVE
jgi:hypothetical protein